MTVVDEIDEGVSDMAETDHTDMSGNEFGHHEPPCRQESGDAWVKITADSRECSIFGFVEVLPNECFHIGGTIDSSQVRIKHKL